MNFIKGSLFRRNTEPEELEPVVESGGGVLAVWGSPGCGKTVTAVKIAKHLASQKKNVALLLCDMTAPMMPCICPPSELECDKSLGSIFAAQRISVNLIKHNLTTHKKMSYLTMLGLRKGENEYTYAACTKQQAEELIRAKREAEANKLIRDFGTELPGTQVLNGRFGPYIAHTPEGARRPVNYRIPKGEDPATLTADRVRELMTEQDAAPRKTTRRRTKAAK